MSVKSVLMQLLLPPLAVAVPWLLPAAGRDWPRFWVNLCIWALGWCVTKFLWAGPGLILLLCLGFFSAMTTRIKI